MKKRTSLLLLALSVLAALVLLAGCAGGEEAAEPLPEGLEETALLEAGREVAGLLSQGDYQAVYDLLRADVRSGLTVDDIAAVMDPVREEAGEFQSEAEASAYGDSEAEPLGIADLLYTFAQEKVRFRVAFDPELTLTGFSAGVERSGWSFDNLVDNITGFFGG